MDTTTKNYDGLLTRDELGVWLHCGERTIYRSHDDCGLEFCMNEVCRACDWDFPECVREDETCDPVCHYCLSENCESNCKRGAVRVTFTFDDDTFQAVREFLEMRGGLAGFTDVLEIAVCANCYTENCDGGCE